MKNKKFQTKLIELLEKYNLYNKFAVISNKVANKKNRKYIIAFIILLFISACSLVIIKKRYRKQKYELSLLKLKKDECIHFFSNIKIEDLFKIPKEFFLIITKDKVEFKKIKSIKKEETSYKGDIPDIKNKNTIKIKSSKELYCKYYILSGKIFFETNICLPHREILSIEYGNNKIGFKDKIVDFKDTHIVKELPNKVIKIDNKLEINKVKDIDYAYMFYIINPNTKYERIIEQECTKK